MTGSEPSTPPSATPPGEIASRYGTAWNAHDPDAILSMHAATSALHVVGVVPRVEGDEQIRATLAGMFDLFPDIHFDPTRIHTCPELLVAEFTATTTLARPLTLGGTDRQPDHVRRGRRHPPRRRTGPGEGDHWLTARNPRPGPIRAMIAVDGVLATAAITLAITNPTAAPTWPRIGLVGVATTALTMGALKHLGLRTQLA